MAHLLLPLVSLGLNDIKVQGKNFTAPESFLAFSVQLLKHIRVLQIYHSKLHRIVHYNYVDIILI